MQNRPLSAHHPFVNHCKRNVIRTNMRTILAIVAFFAAFQHGNSRTESDSDDCPSPFEKIGAKCYHVLEKLQSWDEARVTCRALGDAVYQDADLAIVAECDQHAKLWHHILISHNASFGFHLGGTDRGEEGFWYWLDATPIAMGVPFWRPGDPEGIGNQNCMGFYKDGYFIDRPCDTVTKSVCQLNVLAKI
ncbi:C-type lectin domain family 17, member A-like [Palaemon carinicauda]|uniref:C-type lectin domain family 17, member A-like n=1 Tax=Palaemon carinicauda TaxID=392227 RepID=UPI0035B5A5C9